VLEHVITYFCWIIFRIIGCFHGYKVFLIKCGIFILVKFPVHRYITVIGIIQKRIILCFCLMILLGTCMEYSILMSNNVMPFWSI
jgi:hypothetical protein